jgi:hypothetical protein
VKDERVPVEDPIAAPTVADDETVQALGSEPAPAAAPAVGSLLDGREAGRRERLVGAYGGSDATEAAVARALEWLARQQGKDGLWSLQGPYADGASQENRLAATAMALLAFQGAGNTPQVGQHKKTVATAWAALLKKQVAGGDAGAGDGRRRSGPGRFEITLHDPPERQALYSHAQVTIALCELYGMTKDPAYEQPARRAVAYAVAAQGPNGGWRYEPGQNGDMSVTGWYMMALKSAQMAGLTVPEETLAGLVRFLDSVAVEGGSRYGYRFEIVALADAEDQKVGARSAGPQPSGHGCGRRRAPAGEVCRLGDRQGRLRLVLHHPGRAPPRRHGVGSLERPDEGGAPGGAVVEGQRKRLVGSRARQVGPVGRPPVHDLLLHLHARGLLPPPADLRRRGGRGAAVTPGMFSGCEATGPRESPKRKRGKCRVAVTRERRFPAARAPAGST